MAIVQISDAGQGINLDLPPEELKAGVWSSASNMRFVNGYAQRLMESRASLTPLLSPRITLPTTRNPVAGIGCMQELARCSPTMALRARRSPGWLK